MDVCLRLSNMRQECRNILIVTVTKIVKFENGKEDRPANLSMEDVGTLLFDIIKLDVKDALGVSLTTNQYDTKEMNLKPDVDPSKYLTKAPIEFKGHSRVCIYMVRSEPELAVTLLRTTRLTNAVGTLNTLQHLMFQ